MTDPLFIGIGALLLGAALGFMGARIGGAQRLASAEAIAAAERGRREETEGDLQQVQEQGAVMAQELAVANERLESTRATLEQQRTFLAESKRQLEDSFAALAANALKGSTEQFLSLAEQRLESTRTQAKADLEERKAAIDGMLAPLKKSLDQLDQRNLEMEKARTGAYSQLEEQIAALSTAAGALADKTTALSTTLRGSSNKGRWGEIALRNIVEVAGLTEHVDFEEQQTTEEGGRPDMTVRLPGDRLIAIDAKAPISAYMEAREAETEAARKQALDRHVRALKGHVKTLATRDYASALDAEIDLVVMFLPSDALLSDAYAREPELQTDALRERVLVATPTTLVALLRTVAIYWQQRALAENAAEIASVAGMLYERAAKFGNELGGVGKSLQGAIEAYNRAVGSFDLRLMPMARRLEEMKVAETSRRSVEPPRGIDDSARLPRERD
jgi:DNA recombination protein RmuC